MQPLSYFQVTLFQTFRFTSWGMNHLYTRTYTYGFDVTFKLRDLKIGARNEICRHLITQYPFLPVTKANMYCVFVNGLLMLHLNELFANKLFKNNSSSYHFSYLCLLYVKCYSCRDTSKTIFHNIHSY